MTWRTVDLLASVSLYAEPRKFRDDGPAAIPEGNQLGKCEAFCYAGACRLQNSNSGQATREQPMPASTPEPGTFLHVERRGELAILVPTDAIEKLQWEAIGMAADLILQPLRQNPPTGIIVDLEQVNYFGSVFIAMLLRFHHLVKLHGGDLVICNARPAARELLRVTGMDTLWAIYESRDEALRALS
jgi:anti-sigma B factor antagonist